MGDFRTFVLPEGRRTHSRRGSRDRRSAMWLAAERMYLVEML